MFERRRRWVQFIDAVDVPGIPVPHVLELRVAIGEDHDEEVQLLLEERDPLELLLDGLQLSVDRIDDRGDDERQDPGRGIRKNLIKIGRATAGWF